MTKKDIKKLRKALGLTQGGMATALGVAPITISRWERGGQKPDAVSDRRLNRLAENDR